MGRTACTEPQCLYKGALYLTVVLYLYSPMGRTACTEPQCLYKGTFYLFLLTTFYSLDDLRVACKVRLENVETAEHARQVK